MHRVRKRSLGEVVDLQVSSPPTSRTPKLVDLNSLEKWIYGNLDQGNPKHGYRQGNEWIESSPVEKDLGVWVDKTQSKTHQCALASQKANHIQLHQKKCDQQVTRGESPSLLCSGETPPGIVLLFNCRGGLFKIKFSGWADTTWYFFFNHSIVVLFTIMLYNLLSSETCQIEFGLPWYILVRMSSFSSLVASSQIYLLLFSHSIHQGFTILCLVVSLGTLRRKSLLQES